MLKSTHKSAAPILPLPEGWTEHKAPTGKLACINLHICELTVIAEDLLTFTCLMQDTRITTMPLLKNLHTLDLRKSHSLP